MLGTRITYWSEWLTMGLCSTLQSLSTLCCCNKRKHHYFKCSVAPAQVEQQLMLRYTLRVVNICNAIQGTHQVCIYETHKMRWEDIQNSTEAQSELLWACRSAIFTMFASFLHNTSHSIVTLEMSCILTFLQLLQNLYILSFWGINKKLRDKIKSDNDVPCMFTSCILYIT